MYHALREFANESDLIGKDKFLMVLSEYGLNLDESKFQEFCAR